MASPDDLSLPEVPISLDISPLLSFQILSLDATLTLLSRCSPKTCNSDPMPSQLVKSVSTELAPAIQRIINGSLQNGNFPQRFKNAIVTPRLKKPSLNPDTCSSYRPVSNLSFLSKATERAASDQLTQHLQQHNLFEPLQSAYRPGHSTETAMIRVHDDICHAIGERKVVLLVLLDLSAAFDTVNHELLLSILARYKVGGTALQWFSSYLADRSQSLWSEALPQTLSGSVVVSHRGRSWDRHFSTCTLHLLESC